MDELKGYLRNLNPGPVQQTTQLERLLANVWHDLGGDEGGMTGDKLIGRMGQVEWNSPVLTFTIERHGGTVLGSTRAEVQQWTVDLDSQTAACESIGHRQLSPMAGRVDVEPVADEIAEKILSGEPDDRLRWLPDGRVRVEMGKVFPKGSGYKQTVQGRRRRLREALIERLEPSGWIDLGRNTFGRAVPPTATS